MESSIWETAGPDHPLGTFQRWFEKHEFQPGQVAPWTSAPSTARRRLMAQAMRPAPVTDHWHEAAELLRNDAEEALSGIAIIEADTPRLEALAIALSIREAIETAGQTVSLITPDAALSRRITAALWTFGIVPDDMAGQPLSRTPPGILLELTLLVAEDGTDAVAVAALMQHPLVAPNCERSVHLAHARAFERAVLRQESAVGKEWLKTQWPGGTAEQQDWLSRIETTIAPLRECIKSGAELATIIETASCLP